MFHVPCPTPDGQTAEDLYRKRVDWITHEMQADARELGCTFHRAWHTEDGSAFVAIAHWKSDEAASAFFKAWHIEAVPGEVVTMLEGDVGLVPLGGS